MAELYRESRLKIESPIIVDLGCSVGYESYKLYNIFKPKLLISVDPFQYNIDKTKELIKFDNWTTDCCAVANNDGEALIEFRYSPFTNNSPCGGIVNKQTGTDTRIETIKTKRLDSIHPSIDILKIDVEGYEWIIWDQLLNAESIKVMFLELHGTDLVTIETMFDKLKLLKEKFNLRWFEYGQAQKMYPDFCMETNEKIFTGNGGNFCHVLCERKI